MKLSFLKKILPRNEFGWVSLGTGLLGSILYLTQMIWDWFGDDAIDKTIYSVIVLIPLSLGVVSAYEANKDKREWVTVLKNAFIVLLIAFIVNIMLSGLAMSMDTTLQEEWNESGLGLAYGLRMLSSITTQDVESTARFGIGLGQIIRALFLIVPFLIAAWGGLSVLTADSIDEAEGGIMAIVAAIVVVIVVWMFKLVDVVVG